MIDPVAHATPRAGWLASCCVREMRSLEGNGEAYRRACCGEDQSLRWLQPLWSSREWSVADRQVLGSGSWHSTAHTSRGKSLVTSRESATAHVDNVSPKQSPSEVEERKKTHPLGSEALTKLRKERCSLTDEPVADTQTRRLAVIWRVPCDRWAVGRKTAVNVKVVVSVAPCLPAFLKESAWWRKQHYAIPAGSAIEYARQHQVTVKRAFRRGEEQLCYVA